MKIGKLKVYQYIIILLAIAINVFIIVNACLPGAQSAEESNVVVEVSKNIINTIKSETINETNINTFSFYIRKLIGHFSLFFISGLLTTLSIKYLYYDKYEKYGIFIIISCISGIFLAFLTEFIQHFVPGRSGEIGDVGIDALGYLIATLLVVLIIYLILRNRKTIIKDIK